MDEGGHKKTEAEPEFSRKNGIPPQAGRPQVEKQTFKSNFKTWIRIVAFVVVAVFLPEQVAQAVEYDWRVIWQKPAVGTPFTPSYIKDIRQIDIPLTIKNILKDISGRPINAIKISPTLTVELEKPLNISKERIEEIYNWLKGKPCGSKALYDFLNYKGLSPQGTVPEVLEQDIAVMALTIDILNDVVKPEGNPQVIKNSLYALSKTSEFFGHKLYPVKMQGLSPQGTVPVFLCISSRSANVCIFVCATKNGLNVFSSHSRGRYISASFVNIGSSMIGERISLSARAEAAVFLFSVSRSCSSLWLIHSLGGALKVFSF